MKVVALTTVGRYLVVLMILTLLPACAAKKNSQPTAIEEPAPAGASEPSQPSEAPADSVDEGRESRRRSLRRPLPERLPQPPGDAARTGGAPEAILDAVIADLSRRTGAPREQISVLSDQSVLWPDGSLGCPRPDQDYTLAPQGGYWIVLEVDGDTYDFRANQRGFFFLCSKPARG